MRLAIIIALFLISVVLMYRKKLNTLIGLPAMAILIAIAAHVPFGAILDEVISQGALRLSSPILVIIFGATLAELVKRSGIVEVLIRNTAEFLGDRTLLISIAMMLILTVLFTVLAGLGAIVMVGSIVFPILISLGMSKLLAGCIFLLAVSLGGMLNLFNWSLYTDVLKLSTHDILQYNLRYFPVALAISILFLVIELKREGGSSFKLALPLPKPKVRISSLAFLTPLIPVILIFLNPIAALVLFPLFEKLGSPIGGAFKPFLEFEFPILGTLFLAIVWGVLTAPRSAGPKARLLTRSMFDGITSVAPAIALMIGIGMLLKSVAHPQVKAILGPALTQVIPATRLGYLAFFAALAPLALYRGPLNIWGMGSGLVVLIQETRLIPGAAIMAALISVGQIQGISDPTNTYNVWIANYLGVDVIRFLKKTIVYAWVMAAAGLLISASMYY